MKKFISVVFSLLLVSIIVVGAYFNKPFVLKQFNKAKGIYYVYKGDEAYKKSDLLLAIKMYNTALSYYPRHYGAWHNLGNIYVEYEDYPSGVYAYSQAFKYNPNMMIARMNYGIIQTEKLGDFDSAIEQYKKITETKRRLLSIPYVYDNKVSSKSNIAIAYYNMGVAYRLKAMYNQEDFEANRLYMAKSIEAYKKSIEIVPNNAKAQYNLGIAYYVTGNYEEAGGCYCKAIELSPLSFEAHYNLAILLRKLGHYHEAYEEIEKAMSIITINANDKNTLMQQYVATVFNTISVEYFSKDPSLKKFNEVLLEDKKLSSKQKKGKKKNKNKNKEEIIIDDNDSISISASNNNFFGVKKTKPEDLEANQNIKKEFGTCPSIVYFQ